MVQRNSTNTPRTATTVSAVDTTHVTNIISSSPNPRVGSSVAASDIQSKGTSKAMDFDEIIDETAG
eukprot:7277236-Prorocentrum_lima.AAC.1